MLARYSKLTGLPCVRMDLPYRMRGVEAEFVVTDATGWIDDEAREMALSRATRQLVVM